jgi:hypothetical protein
MINTKTIFLLFFMSQLKDTQRVIIDLDPKVLEYMSMYGEKNFMSRKKVMEMFLSKFADDRRGL